jgi:hypothetical protein
MKAMFKDLLKSGSGLSSIVFNMFAQGLNTIVMTDIIVIGTLWLASIGKPISETLVAVLLAGVSANGIYATHSKVKQNKDTLPKEEVKKE